MTAAQISGSSVAIPIWLVLFVAAGFLLFLLKVSGDSKEREKRGRWWLFLLIATLLCAIAGIADFVRWTQGDSR
jgi:hypothetical protein